MAGYITIVRAELRDHLRNDIIFYQRQLEPVDVGQLPFLHRNPFG